MKSRNIQTVFERTEPGPRKAHKRRIMECALDCFEESGVEAATIDAIRVRSESSIGSIYHHFGSKEGLVAALFFVALDDQTALIDPRLAAATDARQAILATIRSYLEWVTDQPRLARFLFQARSSVAAGPFREALAERNRHRFGLLLDWLARGEREGLIRPLPRETCAPLLIGQSESYCRAWLSKLVKVPPADHAEVFTEAAWRSVAI